MAGVAEPFGHAANAASAEALALRRGLQLVQQIGCSRIIVESDCLEVIDACNGVSDILAPYAATLADCFQLAHGVSSIRFQHCSREANNLAHYLARHAYDIQLMYWWDDEPPSFLLPHVLKDVTLIISQ